MANNEAIILSPVTNLLGLINQFADQSEPSIRRTILDCKWHYTTAMDYTILNYTTLDYAIVDYTKLDYTTLDLTTLDYTTSSEPGQ